MNTKEILKNLWDEHRSFIYKDITKVLSKKLFINSSYINKLSNNENKRIVIYNKVIKRDIEEYFYTHKKEIIWILKTGYFWNNYKKIYNLRREEDRMHALKYVLGWHLNSVISNFKK